MRSLIINSRHYQVKIALPFLLQVAHLPSSTLCDVVEKMHRQYINVKHETAYDHVVLTGLSDDNKFFILCCQPDGSVNRIDESIGNYKLMIKTNGEHLHEPILGYFTEKLIKEKRPLLESLKLTVEYASSIEKTISPTYHYSIINK
jgi:hypothetical protein